MLLFRVVGDGEQDVQDFLGVRPAAIAAVSRAVRAPEVAHDLDDMLQMFRSVGPRHQEQLVEIRQQLSLLRAPRVSLLEGHPEAAHHARDETFFPDLETPNDRQSHLQRIGVMKRQGRILEHADQGTDCLTVVVVAKAEQLLRSEGGPDVLFLEAKAKLVHRPASGCASSLLFVRDTHVPHVASVTPVRINDDNLGGRVDQRVELPCLVKHGERPHACLGGLPHASKQAIVKRPAKVASVKGDLERAERRAARDRARPPRDFLRRVR
mmetsp:Transcript_754/g.3085  ORF Transcript_754/g.3085 Transcript_754/m.3085 type:complete len:267 (+) Transcript_754:162-962(+)